MNAVLEKERKMPRSNGTYQEYEQFLTFLYKSCIWLKESHDPLHQQGFKRIEMLLNGLAVNSGVEKPEDVVWGDESSTHRAAPLNAKQVYEHTLKFYGHFGVAKWNHQDKQAVKELNAILSQPNMRR